MEKETVTAYFMGGKEDGSIKEIYHLENRLNLHGTYYLRRGELKTEKYGKVLVYALEGMSREDELRMIKRIS